MNTKRSAANQIARQQELIAKLTLERDAAVLRANEADVYIAFSRKQLGQVRDIAVEQIAAANERQTVHYEPDDFKYWPAENCSVCGQPTRYWLDDKQTPMCPGCCSRSKSK